MTAKFIVHSDLAIHQVKEVEVKMMANARGFIREFITQMRVAVQDNISTQGATFGDRWAVPSKWIKAKTGLGTVMLKLRKHIKSQVTGEGLHGSVAFEGPGDYTLTQHGQGFVVPATGRQTTLQFRKPAFLGLRNAGDSKPYKSREFKFINRRDSKVPARTVWPSDAQLWAYGQPLLAKWMQRGLMVKVR
jgi:hypothetical protein